MNQLRVPYKVVTLRNIDESYPDDMAAGDVAQYLSGKKADAYREIIGDDELLITADTTVATRYMQNLKTATMRSGCCTNCPERCIRWCRGLR